ncbi:MAG: CPBP family glutamic-type intramembrane protease, partial [Planctomycetota bacterium]
MARTQAPSPDWQAAARRRGLAHPLESLAFVLPLILFYQLGSLWLHPSLGAQTPDRVVAFQLLRVFFELFGPTGQWMPSLAVVAILLAAQFDSRQPWKIRPRAVLLLYAESALWALPLLILCRTLRLAGGAAAERGLLPELVLCVGAGVYEELVFRLILICLVVMIGHDLLHCPATWTTVLAVALSSVLFAAHHHPPVGSEPFEAAHFFFRFLAGAYLGAVFVYRGYGPAAGTHVAYNLIIVV